MAASLAEVREALARRFPDALPLVRRTAVTVPSGIEPLDAMLPNGGFARGRLAVWAPGGGATAILRSACANVVRRGERAVWIDGAGTLAEVWPEGSLLVRPGGELEASRCAEELLRSGGFALVGLSGGGRVLAREAVRLARAAKAGGSAFVVVGEAVPVSALRLASRLPPEGYSWWMNPFGEPAEIESVHVEIRAWSLGWSGRTSFSLPVFARRLRLALEPSLPDRRGGSRCALGFRVSSSELRVSSPPSL
ncbi:MAG: hypothetical protein ACREM1_21065 [Longimicrobiales bacterium]